MHKTKLWGMLALLTSTIFFLSACSGEKPKETSSDTKDETSYTVEHAMGTTEIKGKPEKIVILTNEGTEALLSLGVKPVGAVKSWSGDPWYDHIADDMEGVEVVGTESEVNVEAVAALAPDLIIGNKMRQENIYDQLSAIAPTVYSETLRGDWKVNFEFYAKALNMEEEGQKILGDYNNRITEIQGELGDKVNMEVSLVRFMPGDVRMYHKDTFAGVILEDIGFKRPESQNIDDFAEKNVTKERIPAMDGDILFYYTYETGDGEATKLEEEWINDPLFQNLEVAQNKQVYEVSDVIWNTGGGVISANLMLDDIEKYFLGE